MKRGLLVFAFFLSLVSFGSAGDRFIYEPGKLSRPKVLQGKEKWIAVSYDSMFHFRITNSKETVGYFNTLLQKAMDDEEKIFRFGAEGAYTFTTLQNFFRVEEKKKEGQQKDLPDGFVEYDSNNGITFHTEIRRFAKIFRKKYYQMILTKNAKRITFELRESLWKELQMLVGVASGNSKFMIINLTILDLEKDKSA